ncbi:protein monoglycylase TTLL8 isoform X2 [Ascaphus truei]|uniref:protein monoglycylase TTLL8 isoform X2 n=1 Tax=Ascaphus truei TaxID=8439 RepID=UPI003F59B82F
MKRTRTKIKPYPLSSNGEGRADEKQERRRIVELPSFIRFYRLKQAKYFVERAIRDKTIFTICGHYPIIRESLRRRGWVERKFPALPSDFKRNEEESCEEAHEDEEGKEQSFDVRAWTTKQLTGYYSSVQDRTLSHEEERAASCCADNFDNIHYVMSRLIRTEIPHFIWTIRRDVVDYHCLNKDQILNHYGRTGSFTTKIGMCLNLRNLPWYAEANPDTFFPRCYNLCSEDEKHAFIEDFRHTAARNILKWVVQKGVKKTAKEDICTGKLHCWDELIGIACRICENCLGVLEHNDIDVALDTPPLLSNMEWNEFIQQYYSLIHGSAIIATSYDHIKRCQTILNRITSVKPQMAIEGLRNVWIIKPGAKSRGRDIVCMDNVEEIINFIQTDLIATKDNKWVIQKYIETPLLIYSTKFDIRQWFLVTNWNPLTIWFYKDCYLRFSTQNFSLENLDSSVHLCNNSIQKHLKNCSDRDTLLPHYNMWGSTKFRDYLQNRGFGGVWEGVIYPSMKKAIVYTMKMAQDNVESRKNSFELYGADFILEEDFKPWLIEINSSPTMYPSTPVTAHLCTQVQEDTIKVVIDRKLDKNCDTGRFELIWQQSFVEHPPFSGTSLLIEGSSMKSAKTQGAVAHVNVIGHPSTMSQVKHLTVNLEKPEQVHKPSTKPKQDGIKAEDKILPRNSSVSPPLKISPRKHLKTKHTSTEGFDKLDQIDVPVLKLQQIKNLPKVKHVPITSKTSYSKYSSMDTNKMDTTYCLDAHSLDWSVPQPSKMKGLQNNVKTPCLVCRGTFPWDRTCKNCNSFSATPFLQRY